MIPKTMMKIPIHVPNKTILLRSVPNNSYVYKIHNEDGKKPKLII